LKIPKKIRAFGRIYDVVHDDEITASYDSYGLVAHDKEHVFLKERGTSFSKEKEAATLFHELIHIVEENLRIELTEEQVGLLSVGLYTIIVDNKLDFASGD